MGFTPPNTVFLYVRIRMQRGQNSAGAAVSGCSVKVVVRSRDIDFYPPPFRLQRLAFTIHAFIEPFVLALTTAEGDEKRAGFGFNSDSGATARFAGRTERGIARVDAMWHGPAS